MFGPLICKISFRLKKLEAILPTKPIIEIPKGDHVDEVSMVDYESTKGSSKSRSGAHAAGHGGPGGFFGGAEGDDDEDDEMGGAGGGQQFACNTQ